MVIRRVLEAIFGSPAKIRILRVLSTSPQPLSGRQVGELSALSHRGAIQHWNPWSNSAQYVSAGSGTRISIPSPGAI